MKNIIKSVIEFITNPAILMFMCYMILVALWFTLEYQAGNIIITR